METPEKALAKRLRELRRRHFGPRGKAEFAQRLQIPLDEYERYERGTLPPGELMVRACEVTGEDLQWLLTGVAARGTVVISGARNRHADLLTRIAGLLDQRPTLAAAIEAFLGLLEAGEEVRPAVAPQLTAPRAEHLIRILAANELPRELPDGDDGSGVRRFFELALRGALSTNDAPRPALLHEPASRYFAERAQSTQLVRVRDESGRDHECLQDARIAECFPRAFGVFVPDDAMRPMFATSDAVIVAPDIEAKVGRPAVCRLASDPAARVRVWLGHEDGAANLGRVADGVIEQVAADDLLWSLEALFRLAPAA